MFENERFEVSLCNKIGGTNKASNKGAFGLETLFWSIRCVGDTRKGTESLLLLLLLLLLLIGIVKFPKMGSCNWEKGEGPIDFEFSSFEISEIFLFLRDGFGFSFVGVVGVVGGVVNISSSDVCGKLQSVGVSSNSKSFLFDGANGTDSCALGNSVIANLSVVIEDLKAGKIVGERLGSCGRTWAPSKELWKNKSNVKSTI